VGYYKIKGSIESSVGNWIAEKLHIPKLRVKISHFRKKQRKARRKSRGEEKKKREKKSPVCAGVGGTEHPKAYLTDANFGVTEAKIEGWKSQRGS